MFKKEDLYRHEIRSAQTEDVQDVQRVSSGVDDEPISQIVSRFLEQDKAEAEAEEQSPKEPLPLISRERLIEIVENSKKNKVPYELLGYLWELWDDDEDFGEPPMVRALDALTEVLRPFYEKGAWYELLGFLLSMEEGDDLAEKLEEPQPQSEIDSPENLYQLVRKAWDQNRMDELIAMIEEYEDEVYGITIEEAIREHREWADSITPQDAFRQFKEWLEKRSARNSRLETSS
jgi:hypothetical protein